MVRFVKGFGYGFIRFDVGLQMQVAEGGGDLEVGKRGGVGEGVASHGRQYGESIWSCRNGGERSSGGRGGVRAADHAQLVLATGWTSRASLDGERCG